MTNNITTNIPIAPHTLYTKGLRIYEVLFNDDDHNYATYFYQHGEDKYNPELTTRCATLPPTYDPDEAQTRLDDYARKQGFAVYKPEESIAEDYPTEDDVEEQCELVTDETEVPECTWENASGNDTDDTEAENTISGKRVDLCDAEFGAIIATCNEDINRALVTAITEHQGFTFNLKITFSPTGNRFTIKQETEYKFDPIKKKTKGQLYDDITIILDNDGNPIIPEDRQHQLTFGDTAPTMTVTADSSGVVQSVDIDGDSEDLPFPEAEELYSCDNIDCPLYTGYNGTSSGCSFVKGDSLDDDVKGQIFEAVTEYGCKRDCIAEICNTEFPREDIESEDFYDED